MHLPYCAHVAVELLNASKYIRYNVKLVICNTLSKIILTKMRRSTQAVHFLECAHSTLFSHKKPFDATFTNVEQSMISTKYEYCVFQLYATRITSCHVQPRSDTTSLNQTSMCRQSNSQEMPRDYQNHHQSNHKL